MRNLIDICNELENTTLQPYKNICNFNSSVINSAAKIQRNEILQQRNNILAKQTGYLAQLVKIKEKLPFNRFNNSIENYIDPEGDI